MKKLHYEILINASREKVWDTMLGDKTYRIWTVPFNPGSFYKGTWEKGSKIKFFGTDKDGKIGGMSSEIAESRKPEFVSIHHLGFIKDGIEDFDSDEVKAWTPSFENYTLKDVDGQTHLYVELDSPSKYEGMFDESWPKSLDILKELCEK